MQQMGATFRRHSGPFVDGPLDQERCDVINTLQSVSRAAGTRLRPDAVFQPLAVRWRRDHVSAEQNNEAD